MRDISPSEIDNLRTWIGRSEVAEDFVTPRLVKSLRATLFMEPGEPKIGDPVPWTTHWCFILDIAAASEIGRDGHPKRGGFLPPVPLPRRMWAGGKTDYVDTIRVGDRLERRTEIADVVFKTGSTGQLCFVTVNHSILTGRGLAVQEKQDIVYRGEAGTTAALVPPRPTLQAQKTSSLIADPVLLFRYSAVMFNGHRIHYDRDYAMNVEGYGGLVVHGPLQAALLAEMAAQMAGKGLKSFSHRGMSPLLDGPFTLNATETPDGLDLWTETPAGALAMKASASW